MSDDLAARIVAQREKVLDELKALDGMYVEAGIVDGREPGDMLTHCTVVTSWQRMAGDPAFDSSSITHYRLTDMPPWQELGLLEAQAGYTRRDLLAGDFED